MSKSIIQEDKDICYICNKYIYNGRDCHHIYNGSSNRNKSDEDGMVVYVHHCCHMWLHNHPISNRTIKKRCQKIWMNHYGKSEEDFIKRYGKSYLEE